MNKVNEKYKADVVYFSLKEEAKDFIAKLRKHTNIEFQNPEDETFLELNSLLEEERYIKVKVGNLEVIDLLKSHDKKSHDVRRIMVEFESQLLSPSGI